MPTNRLTMPPIAVLNYHHVHDLAETAFRVTPAKLQAQMEFLLTEGYTPLHLDQVIALKGALAPPKAVLVTFDDAYENFLGYAWPILKRLHIPTTLFVIGHYVGGDNAWDSLRVSVHRHLDLAQLNQLQAEGVTIGFHSQTHPPLVVLSEAELLTEIRDSKVDLEQKLGITIRALAYPGGHVNNRVRKLTSRYYDLGFATSLDAHGTFGNPYLIPRFDPSFCGELSDFQNELELYSGQRKGWDDDGN